MHIIKFMQDFVGTGESGYFQINLSFPAFCISSLSYVCFNNKYSLISSVIKKKINS
jgi:hypothetical protein